MTSFVIEGGNKLEGEVSVQGSKNAAGPLIAATLLTEKTCILRNIPRVEDVFVLLEIMRTMGSKQKWLDDHTIEIVNDDIDPSKIDRNLVSKIRLSILLVGPLLARFGEIITTSPGGCQLGARPIKTHLDALRASGVDIQYESDEDLYTMKVEERSGGRIVFGEFSVTATENMLMFHTLNPNSVTLDLVAAEPHIQDLGNFLRQMGVNMKGHGTHTIRMRGIEKVEKDVDHSVTPDYLEAGTLLVAGIATHSTLTLTDVDPMHLTSVLYKLKEFGAHVEVGEDTMKVEPVKRLQAAKVQTLPHPGFPTDLQALFGVLATQAEGTSMIFDTLYESRLKYIGELKKMGADADVIDPHRALVTGPTPLFGIEIKSFDIRAGATLVVAALIAKGESVIREVQQIDRGYEKLDEKLRDLGADIRRIE